MMIKSYIQQNEALLINTLQELCAIPAPSHHEQQRADYCKQWLEKVGAQGVYIDSALNVIFPLNCGNSKEITVIGDRPCSPLNWCWRAISLRSACPAAAAIRRLLNTWQI